MSSYSTITVDAVGTRLAFVDSLLRSSASTLAAPASVPVIDAAIAELEHVETTLGGVARDLAEPVLSTRLGAVRDQLSAHLLAASACQAAEVSADVTAGVLKRAVQSTQEALQH
jgi:hypothetical protein